MSKPEESDNNEESKVDSSNVDLFEAVTGVLEKDPATLAPERSEPKKEDTEEDTKPEDKTEDDTETEDLDLDLESILEGIEDDEPDKKDEEEKPTEQEDDDLTRLENQDGSKPGEKTAAFIKDLKTKLQESTQKLSDLETSTVPKDEFDKIAKERDELRDKIDTIHFEHSDSFKKKYIEPVNSQTKKAAEIIKRHVSIEEASPHWDAAISSLLANNEADYFKRVSDISDLIDGSASKHRLDNAMTKLWELNEEKLEAANHLNDTREKLVQEKQDEASRDVNLASQKIDSIRVNIEQEDPIVQFYRKDGNAEIFKYDEFVDSGIAEAKKALGTFIKTGVLSDDFGKILISGAASNAHLNANRVLTEALKSMKDGIASRDAKIKTLARKLKMIAPNKFSSNSVSGKRSQDRKEGTDSGRALYDVVKSITGE